MKRWPTKPLGELAANEDGAVKIGPFGSQLKKCDLVQSGIHVLGIENVVGGKFDGFGERYITREKFQDLLSVEVRAGDLLITMMGTVGKVAIVPEGTNCSVMDSHLLRFRPNPAVCLPEFVAWVIRGSPAMKAAIEGRAHGAIMKGLNSSLIKSLPAPVPPLAEQERIVKLLDEADELRKLRAQADHRTAALIPALFHEMFGDPIKHSKRWPQCSFADAGKLDRGRSKNRPRDEPSLYGGKHPFIQTGDVANSNGQITTYTQTYSERGLAQSRMWPAGTLVITIAANIGKTAILTFPACFPDSMVGFIPGERVFVDYVRQWLVTMESRFEEAAPQMAQKNINLRILSELTIPVPPLPLQKEFAQRVTEIREVEAAQAASRRRLEDLFQSLLHRAFDEGL
jgi:type I restriction enzyme S subunit